MKPAIAFVTGGYSGEAEISYKSALTIENNIDRDAFAVYKIDITPEGWWYRPADGSAPVIVDKSDFSITENGSRITFDAVLMGIHGTPGEDGRLQGYFDLLKMPYTSCDTATSAITFNKRYTVAVAAFSGLSVSRSLHIFRHAPPAPESILKELKLPLFVKPNNGGSSIGMSRVNKAEDLTAALEKAFLEDDQVLVEEFIEGREFTIGVYRSKGTIVTLPITEIKTSKEFFDFEAKYSAGVTEEITPALVEEPIAEKIRAAAKKIYAIFNCRGVVRIDFIYNEAAEAPYMLEINTVPGQSEASIVPQQIKAAGGTLKEFYTSLILECLGSDS